MPQLLQCAIIIPLMEVYLIRHGESEGNAVRAGGGRFDWLLSPLGIAQAAALARTKFTARLTHIYSSPLSRTLDTARAIQSAMTVEQSSEIGIHAESASIAARTPPNFEIDERLIDVDAGELNGAPWSLVREKYIDFFRSVPRSPGLPFPGGSESNRDVIERTRSFAGDLKARFRVPSGAGAANAEHRYSPAAHVAIVGHGLPLNYLLQILLELEPIGIECFQFANASVTQVSFKLTYPVLAVYNDVSHLAHLEGAPPFSQGIELERGPASGE